MLESSELVEIREEVKTLYFEYKNFNELRKRLAEESPARKKILQKLSETSHTFPFQAEEVSAIEKGAVHAREKLKELKEIKTEYSNLKLTTVGHAHIDAAWLWPWSETVRKCGRSFSTAVKLINQYPDFNFLQSQPHLYEFIKNRYTDLYERIGDKVESGSWETVGGAWVESDVNLSGGEALARQYLYGKRYLREEFDTDPKITFIPDVFGYSPALPGIARAADCPYFFTQKMSWSEVNDFPHHSFLWEGIDGSQLIAHFPPSDTYHGMTFDEPVEELVESAKNFSEAGELEEAAYLIGWGDGGGGPNRDMIEQVETLNEISALPELEFGRLKDFFARLENQSDKLDKWVGELYLERHRGTLTTQGRTKWYNRKLEFALREAEIWSTLGLLKGEEFTYPKEKLDWSWKVLLFHQFHDILPGSSIREVYEDAERDYSEALGKVENIIDKAKEELAGAASESDKWQVFNSLSWEMDRFIEIEKPELAGEKDVYLVDEEGNEMPAQISGRDKSKLVFQSRSLPPLGSKSFELLAGETDTGDTITVGKNRLENSVISLEVKDNGTVAVKDKERERDVLSGSGNRLVAYRDLPTEFDAWEIEGDIYEVSEELPPPSAALTLEEGPVRGILRQEREFGDSSMVQDIIIYGGSKRIDFETRVDWREENTLLKTHFPVDVKSEEATYEVQYGHYNRPTHNNTSWDKARFEVPHQKWVDVSEYGYGAALLNDCKYGVNVDGANIGLSLLRAPKSPDPEADMMNHEFTYSLLPHHGDFRESGVIRQAYDLNYEPGVQSCDKLESLEPLLEVGDDGIVVEAIKRSEDTSRAIVVRCYEAWGRQVETSLEFGFEPGRIFRINLIEDEKEELAKEEPGLKLDFSPFEIKSLKIFYG